MMGSSSCFLLSGRIPVLDRLPASDCLQRSCSGQGLLSSSSTYSTRSQRSHMLLVREGLRLRITAFLEEDSPLPTKLTDRDVDELSFRAHLESNYAKLGSSLMFPSHPVHPSLVKSDTGGPGGGRGKGYGGGGDGDGSGDGNSSEGDGDSVYLLPLLSFLFAAVHFLYCVVVSFSSRFEMEFCRTGLGLFTLLAATVFRINRRTGIDAYILGLGASVGVMVWTGERCLVKKEYLPSAIVALAAGVMAVVFTGALYHSI